MKEISRTRFDAFAAHARSPLASLISREVEWFESLSGSVFATLIIDPDGEFSGYVFAPDADEKFRCVEQTGFSTDRMEIRKDIATKIEEVEANFARKRVQGDETKKLVDFFTPIVKSKRLHKDFNLLIGNAGFAAAKSLLEVMMRWYEDQDGNFIEQFQTTGFNARIWELYLHAAFVEAGYSVSHPKPAPDFLLTGVGYAFTVEATTINPSMVGGEASNEAPPATAEELLAYVNNYLPIRYAGPLTAKLRKRYWEHPQANGKPLVIAIQDFHKEMSMTYSGDALPTYLYGIAPLESGKMDGATALRPNTTKNLRWKTKEVESGFFYLPESEHISAVIFNPAGTLTKFNRIGVQSGFGAKNVQLRHVGERVDLSNESGRARFSELVTQDHVEGWVDGMTVFHNPNAIVPLRVDALEGAAHVRVGAEGALEWLAPERHLLSSKTAVVVAEA